MAGVVDVQLEDPDEVLHPTGIVKVLARPRPRRLEGEHDVIGRDAGVVLGHVRKVAKDVAVGRVAADSAGNVPRVVEDAGWQRLMP